MANRNFSGKVKSLNPEVVKLYSAVLSDGTDQPTWLDDSTSAATARAPSGDNGRNLGIYGWSRQGAGNYKIVLQDSYSYLLGVNAFCGDESTTDDQVVGFTLLSEDVDSSTSPSISGTDGATAAGPLVQIQLYDDSGNAQEVTANNKIFVELSLANKKSV